MTGKDLLRGNFRISQPVDSFNLLNCDRVQPTAFKQSSTGPHVFAGIWQYLVANRSIRNYIRDRCIQESIFGQYSDWRSATHALPQAVLCERTRSRTCFWIAQETCDITHVPGDCARGA